jgi:hypothetical protein
VIIAAAQQITPTLPCRREASNHLRHWLRIMQVLRKTPENCPPHGAAHLAIQHWLLRD